MDASYCPRKLETLEGIYQKISDQVVRNSMEMLEWIIIFLIAILYRPAFRLSECSLSVYNFETRP